MKSLKLVGALFSALILVGAFAGSALAGGAGTGTSGRTVVHFPARGPGRC